MKATTRLRNAIAVPSDIPFIFPSVHDALSARVAAAAGFKACALGSSQTSASLLGKPDCGYLTLTEMEFVTRRVALASSLPVIVDVDDGYGSARAAAETVRVLEIAGAAGIMIEDQKDPRIPFFGGVILNTVDEQIGKLKAALDARTDPDFFIIARTEAYSVEGLDAAIDRSNRYAEVGADATFVVGLLRHDDLKRVAAEVRAPHKMPTPLLHPGDDPTISLHQLRALGYDMIPLGMATARIAGLAMYNYLRDIIETGNTADERVNAQCRGTPLEDWFSFTGVPEFQEFERKYLSEEEYRRRYNRPRD